MFGFECLPGKVKHLPLWQITVPESHSDTLTSRSLFQIWRLALYQHSRELQNSKNRELQKWARRQLCDIFKLGVYSRQSLGLHLPEQPQVIQTIDDLEEVTKPRFKPRPSSKLRQVIVDPVSIKLLKAKSITGFLTSKLARKKRPSSSVAKSPSVPPPSLAPDYFFQSLEDEST